MIKDIKELQQVMKLCRKYGLIEIHLGDFKASFKDFPDERQVVEEELDPMASGSDKYILDQLGLTP